MRRSATIDAINSADCVFARRPSLVKAKAMLARQERPQMATRGKLQLCRLGFRRAHFGQRRRLCGFRSATAQSARRSRWDFRARACRSEKSAGQVVSARGREDRAEPTRLWARALTALCPCERSAARKLISWPSPEAQALRRRPPRGQLSTGERGEASTRLSIHEAFDQFPCYACAQIGAMTGRTARRLGK